MAYDLLVIGGGINGTAIARAAAVAGRRVVLVEQDDLAQGTSSASTKLMHGGLRYLERYEFRLVHESLVERSIMLEVAPHLVRPLEFRIAPGAHMRRWPILRLGLLLYDLLAWQGTLPRSRTIRLDDTGLHHAQRWGLSYWDAQVDDARLVVANALDAESLGAKILTRTRFVSATRRADKWTVALETSRDRQEISTQMIVNAAGPWVETVLREGFATVAVSRLRLVRGSHIVVRRCFDGSHAWLFQPSDGRIVFAIPYQQDYTLIGTTDVPVDDPGDTHISEQERDYLLAIINRYRREPLSSEAIIHSYAGIRALYDDGRESASAISRDHHFEFDKSGPPLLSLFGGKITTARRLAEEALARLGIPGGGTRHRPLPGGDFVDFAALLDTTRRRWPFLDSFTAARMTAAYGTHTSRILGYASTPAELGRDFGAGLRAREVDYLIAHEWVQCAQDILWRRSKLGLRLNPAQVTELQAYIQERHA